MIEPNFGESQLQQVVNTALTQFAHQHYGTYANAVVPTLVAECGLGWDSGFYFPWLGYAPLADHEGCNFFIQYKPSILIEGTRGSQWSFWNEKYFRFKIPHVVKNGNRYEFDYHQFDSLKLLSLQNCEVYYATNHVTLREDLFAEAASGTLLDKIPFLDVRDMQDRHVHATFTSDSNHFYLHSKPVKSVRLSGSKALSNILEKKRMSMRQGNEQLLSCLEMLGEYNPAVWDHIERYRLINETELPIPRSLKPFAEFHFLRNAFREIIGVNVYRI